MNISGGGGDGDKGKEEGVCEVNKNRNRKRLPAAPKRRRGAEGCCWDQFVDDTLVHYIGPLKTRQKKTRLAEGGAGP